MHDNLASLYHLGLRLWGIPTWRPAAAALCVGLLARVAAPRQARAGAAASLLAGWIALTLPASLLPAEPLARLPGAALLLLLAACLTKRFDGWRLAGFALAAAWWLRGAPLNGPGIAGAMPVFLGLLAALPLTRRLARADQGVTGAAAALTLGAGIIIAGGAYHWGRAALAPAAACLAFLGIAEAQAVLQAGIVLLAAATIVASDRGRFIPVDAAALMPLLVWALAPRLLPRLQKAGPALAAGLAAAAALALFWVAVHWPR